MTYDVSETSSSAVSSCLNCVIMFVYFFISMNLVWEYFPKINFCFMKIYLLGLIGRSCLPANNAVCV